MGDAADHVLLVVAWLAGWWLLWRLPRVGAPDATGAPAVPSVSVIVPARDEARVLPALLGALRASRTGGIEVVVVDDHSTDDTAGVARDGGAVVVPSAPLPVGWTGKAWACHQGVTATHGDVLVFLDADTVPHPDAIPRLLAERARRGGLVSVQPYHVTVTPSERLAALFNVVAFMGVGSASAPPRARVRTAFGPCLVTSRADYVRVGGHEAVRSAVLEDVALAARYDAAGLPVAALAGRDVVDFRMYPDGLGHLVEGFSKNFAAGARSIPWWRALLVFVWITGLITAAFALPIALVRVLLGGGADLVVPLVAYVAYAAQLAVHLRRLGRFGVVVWTVLPVPVVAFLAVFVRSVLLAVRGEVRWKGRAVATRGPEAS